MENSPKAPTKKEMKEMAMMLGRQGGLKGGKARAEALTAEERKAIAAKGGRARAEKAKLKRKAAL